MKDSRGSIIYVGKSKSLRNRVQTYFQNSKDHSNKVEKLVKNIKDFEYILTDTEFEALLLECQLIHKLKPMYNSMMKTPKSYTYIVINLNEDFSNIQTTSHKNENDGNYYFGPFTSKNTVEKAVRGLKEFLQIDCTYTSKRVTPCLNYTLGLCIGMCLGKLDVTNQYHAILTNIIALLNGTDKSILKDMKKKMLYASENFDFEAAAKYRNYIEAITSLLKKEKVIKFTKKNKNIVMIESLDGHTIKLFLIKGDKVLFREKYQLESSNLESLHAQIKSNIITFFNLKTNQSRKEISKDELDHAQIIYSYIKSNNSNFITIPNIWIKSKEHDRIDLAITELLILTARP